MIIEQINARWWFALNGLIRRAMVRGAPGFGPPKIVLTEYPKSGGTWITQMLAAYLGVPNPRNRLPPRRRCVVHGHFMDVAGANDTVVVWRDGRDVMVSYYYYALQERPTIRSGWVRMHRRRIGMDDVRDVRDVHRYLPRFIEYCFTSGLPRGMSWASFAEVWKSRTDCVETSYEAMTADPKREMTRLLGAVTHPARRPQRPARRCGIDPPGALVDDARLDACIAAFSFEKVTGRKRGDEDTESFVRKGIVGDWKSKFSREAREVFDHYAGRTLTGPGSSAPGPDAAARAPFSFQRPENLKIVQTVMITISTSSSTPRCSM